MFTVDQVIEITSGSYRGYAATIVEVNEEVEAEFYTVRLSHSGGYRSYGSEHMTLKVA